MKEEPVSRTSPTHPPIVATLPIQFSVPLSEWHSCFQAHPSSQFFASTHYSDGSESDDYDEEDIVDHIVDRLKSSASGSLSAGPLCSDIRKNSSWDIEIDSAGGFKSFCLDHDDKFKWVSDGGGGRVELVKSGNIPVGAKVCIKTESPAYGWGTARSWSVGTVRSFRGSTYTVDFPEAPMWKGQEVDLGLAGPDVVDRSKTGSGDWDPRDWDLKGNVAFAFDKYGFVCHKGDRKFEFTGDVDRNKAIGLCEYGFVHGQQKLKPTAPYFEVTILADTPHGVGIGLGEDSFFAGSMVGWSVNGGGSIGIHSDDGCLYADGGGDNLPFGPASSAGDTIGCGIIFDPSNKPETIFFTRNQSIIGRLPLTAGNYDRLFPVVTSASPAGVQVNLAATPPTNLMACTLKTFEFQARYYIDFTWAVGSPRDMPAGMDVVLSAPEKADADITNADQLVGKMAVAYRGGNTFLEKIERLVAAGAHGVIIINTEDILFSDFGSSCSIPVVMIKAKDATALLESGDTSCLCKPVSNKQTIVVGSKVELTTDHANYLDASSGPLKPGKHPASILNPKPQTPNPKPQTPIS